MSSLQGKVALVTGASRGIGKAIAAAFAREGAAVAICARKRESLEETARKIGGGVLAIAAHVGQAEDIGQLVETVQTRLGPIDILVYNAGTNVQQGHCLEADDSESL